MELKYQVASWLAAFQIFPEDSYFLHYDWEIESLIEELKDGVLLCKLAQAVDPSSIDNGLIFWDVNGGDSDLYYHFCHSNLTFFVRAIVVKFGMEIDQTFNPSDLLGQKNIGKVIKCLSTLSKNEKVLKFGIPSFPPAGVDINKLLDEESFQRHFLDEEWKPNPISNEDQIKVNPAKSELALTEASYLRRLIILRDFYKKRLKDSLNEDDLELIFFKVDHLIDLHSRLLIGLDPDGDNIGLSFSNASSEITNVYSDFSVNLKAVKHRVHKLKVTNSKFREIAMPTSLNTLDYPLPLQDTKYRKFLDANNSIPEFNHSLMDLLHFPLQRFMQYHLLLGAIIKNDPDPALSQVLKDQRSSL